MNNKRAKHPTDWPSACKILSKRLGIQVRQAHRTSWKAQGAPIPDGKGKPLDVAKIEYWYKHEKLQPGEHYSNGARGRAAGLVRDNPLDAVNASMAAAKLRRIELQNTKSEGKLIDVDTVRDQAQQEVANCKAWLTGNFPAVVYDIATSKDRLEAIKMICDAVVQRLNAMAAAAGQAPQS